MSHSIQLADALIGATAIAYGLPILTGNDKHYKVLKNVQIKISELSRLKPQQTSRLRVLRSKFSSKQQKSVNSIVAACLI